VLGELTGEDESDGGLDLAGGEGVLLVVSDELGGLEGDLLEDVVDERVHDLHGSLGNTGLGVDLLEDSVDVDGEGLGPLSLVLDSGSLDNSLGSGGSSGGSGSLLGGHIVYCFCLNYKVRLTLYTNEIANYPTIR
jgi:hypothetical protein